MRDVLAGAEGDEALSHPEYIRQTDCQQVNRRTLYCVRSAKRQKKQSMVGEQSEMEAGAPDGVLDTRAESRRKGGKKGEKEGGREGGALWLDDRKRSGADGLCKGPGVSMCLVGFWSHKTGQLGWCGSQNLWKRAGP